MPILLKAISNYLNNSILLFGSHLVVRWQAQAARKNIGADIVCRATIDIGVRLAAAVAVGCHKRVHSVDWLHMHRLPDWAAFGIEFCQSFKDFRRAGFAFL